MLAIKSAAEDELGGFLCMHSLLWFVDVHMHMPASWSLGRAAALRTSVEQALMSAVPGLRHPRMRRPF